MRIVAWNCCRGPIARKVAALESLRPDVAVLSEALEPPEETDQLLWFPSNASRLGIQVRAFGQSKLERLKAADLPNCVVPVRVTGPVSFNLLAVWTWPAPNYTKAFLNGLSAYAHLLRRGPTVVAGDFNGNPMFDKPTQRNKWWTQGFCQLQDAGLVSAYHEFNGVAFGREPHATHHFLRKPERPFHIDFCFVPRPWAQNRLEARVVTGPEWSALSDHFPIVVDTDAQPVIRHMPIDADTLSSLASDYAKGMTSIRGRRVQRLLKREFAGAEHVMTVQVDSGTAVLGISSSGAAFCATDGRGKQASVVKWLHGSADALETHFDLLKDSLPVLGSRSLPSSTIAPRALALVSTTLQGLT